MLAGSFLKIEECQKCQKRLPGFVLTAQRLAARNAIMPSALCIWQSCHRDQSPDMDDPLTIEQDLSASGLRIQIAKHIARNRLPDTLPHSAPPRNRLPIAAVHHRPPTVAPGNLSFLWALAAGRLTGRIQIRATFPVFTIRRSPTGALGDLQLRCLK
jgi:hypothetical protein